MKSEKEGDLWGRQPKTASFWLLEAQNDAVLGLPFKKK